MRNTASIRVLSTYQATRHKKYQRASMLLKRLLDICASAAGLLFLSPVFLYIAWRIRRDSTGPIFYRGDRVGKNGKRFKILKFRTMRETPDSHLGPRLTAQDDPRVTSFGHWLRNSKLNELPQLWNVLKGEMSLVGPRPEDPLFADTWPKDVRQEILSVRPGITSPASIVYRDEEALLKGQRVMDTYLFDILPSKLRLDQLYVRHSSFWGDLDIIFWTLLSLVPQMRDKEVSESNLFIGPLARLMRRHVRWFITDAFVTLIAIGMAGAFWRSLGPLHVGWESALFIAFCFAALFSLSNVLLKTNKIEWSRAAAEDALDLIPGIFLSLFAALLLNNLLPAEWLGIPQVFDSSNASTPGIINFWGTRTLLPNGMLVLSAGLAAVGFVIVRYRTRLITGLATRWINLRGVGGRGLERALVIGGGDTGQYAAWLLQNSNYSLSLDVVGFIDDNLSMQDTRIHGLNVLGRREDIPDLVHELDIGIIIFAIHNISAKERQQIIESCQKTSARIFDFPDIPKAIRRISKSNGNHSGSNLNTQKLTALKQSLAQGENISPEQVKEMLIQLEKLVQVGDMSNTLAEIHELRQAVNLHEPVSQAQKVSIAD